MYKSFDDFVQRCPPPVAHSAAGCAFSFFFVQGSYSLTTTHCHFRCDRQIKGKTHRQIKTCVTLPLSWGRGDSSTRAVWVRNWEDPWDFLCFWAFLIDFLVKPSTFSDAEIADIFFCVVVEAWTESWTFFVCVKTTTTTNKKNKKKNKNNN